MTKNYGDITAQRLRELREANGYSYSMLAKKFNERYKDFTYTDKDDKKHEIKLSESALKSFEVGDKPHSKRLAGDGMGIRYLRCLAIFYGVSADYLLGLTDAPIPLEMPREVKETPDKAKEARNAYYRQYRAKNRDRIKAINQRYWEKKAEALNTNEVINFE